MYYRLSEFWRVGYHASPLEVSLEYQDGSGRFDDPQRKLAVLYGGDSATTCILEVALLWEPHVDATYVEQSEAPDEEMDAGEHRLAIDQAERDREIAKRPPTMPASLYDSARCSSNSRGLSYCAISTTFPCEPSSLRCLP